MKFKVKSKKWKQEKIEVTERFGETCQSFENLAGSAKEWRLKLRLRAKEQKRVNRTKLPARMTFVGRAIRHLISDRAMARVKMHWTEEER